MASDTIDEADALRLTLALERQRIAGLTLDVLRYQMAVKYNLKPGDDVNFDTCVITRAAAPPPPLDVVRSRGL